MPAYWDMEHHKVDFWHKNAVQGQEAYAQASESWNRERQFTMINIQRLQQMRDWFEQPRTQDVIHGRPWALQPSIDNRPPERSLGLPSLTGWGQPRQQPKHDERIVAIIDAGGTILDELQDIELSNERTAVLSTKAVLRPIKVRDAKRFPDVTKPSIYSIADGRGVGWISCMIQATGTLQKKKCQCCTNNESPFEGCIAVGGDAFPKCGNCEWNGKSCQGLEPLSPANISVSGFKAVSQASMYEPGSRKRKRPHSNGTQSPPAHSVGEPSTVDADADKKPARKKQKATAWVLDSLETGKVSDTDSCSGAPIAEDEFRIYQIQTRQFTSSKNVTQYWRWVLEGRLFEYQVLEETNPVVWGVYREPIDFSLRLEDVVQISWNLKALRVRLVISDRQICVEDGKPRGDIMVAFKRQNTMRRFITLCRREELGLVEETRETMELLWEKMQFGASAGGHRSAQHEVAGAPSQLQRQRS